MPHNRQQPPKRMFLGAELPRLAVGMLMLVVLAMLIARTSDPDTWRWLVHDEGGPSAKHGQDAHAGSVAEKTPLPEPAGPTDEDPDEAETAKGEFQAVTDGASTLGVEEMAAYDRLVSWVKSQSFERLFTRARKDLWYTDLYDQAEKHRGDRVAMDMNIRRAKDAGKNREGVPLFEAWGTSEESRGRLYDLIVVDYPKDMPVGYALQERARFAGYFLKLQGYQSALARPGDPLERAPLLIGRLDWRPAAAPQTDNRWQWAAGAVLLVLVGAILLAQLVRRKAVPRRASTLNDVVITPSGDTVSLEHWLEQSDGNRDHFDETHSAEDENG
jgi:hypothetical protein